MFNNNISENDFSSQKSYIRLGWVKCVGKVEGVAAKTSTKLYSEALKLLKGSKLKME